MEEYGTYLTTRGEPRGLWLAWMKWRVALRLAKQIYRHTFFIIKPADWDSRKWTVAAKIMFLENELGSKGENSNDRT